MKAKTKHLRTKIKRLSEIRKVVGKHGQWYENIEIYTKSKRPCKLWLIAGKVGKVTGKYANYHEKKCKKSVVTRQVIKKRWMINETWWTGKQIMKSEGKSCGFSIVWEMGRNMLPSTRKSNRCSKIWWWTA